jgi:hypothetical protein
LSAAHARTVVPQRSGVAVAASHPHRPVAPMDAHDMRRQWAACGAAVRAFCRTDVIDDAFYTVVEPFYVIAAFNAYAARYAGQPLKMYLWNESLRLKHTYRLPAHVAELITDLYARGRLIPPCAPLSEGSFAKLNDRRLQASAALALAFVTDRQIAYGEADAILRRAFSYIRPLGVVVAEQGWSGGGYDPFHPIIDRTKHPSLANHAPPCQQAAPAALWMRSDAPHQAPPAMGALDARQFELLQQAVNTVTGMSV